MSVMTLQVLGIREQVARFERMSDFQKIGKPAVQAALDVYRDEAKGSVKRLTGKASSSMGTHIHIKKWGVYGNAGPRGSSRFREGFLTALFLNTGTGEGLHNAYSAGGAKFGQQAPGGYARESGPFQMGSRVMAGRNRRIHATRSAGLIYPEKMSVMSFPAKAMHNGKATLFGQRFGANAKSTTKPGAYKQKSFGSLGKAFAAYTRGMPPQPWAAAAHHSAASPARTAFQEALHKSIAEMSRVH